MTDAIELAKTFSLHDEGLMQDPYPLYHAARSKCPIARSEELGGFYFVTRFDTIKRVYSDFRDFSSDEGAALPPQPVKMFPIDLDPPEQTKFRKVLNPLFTPEAVAQHRARLQGIADGLIDAFIESGSAELCGQYLRPAIATMVLPLIGVPLADCDMIVHQLEYLTIHRVDAPGEIARIGEAIGVYLMRLAAQRRGAEPKDDVLQILIDAPMDGTPLSDQQIFQTLIIILFGGLDTTSAAISEALLHLVRNPRDAERLRRGQADWGVAIEEFIRFSSPVQGLRRTVRREVEVEGRTLAPGEVVIALNGAANRDPARFAEPDRCIIDRRDNNHIAFGAGAHICLGRNVARLEMEVLIRAILDRLGDLRILEDFVPEYTSSEGRGMKRLPTNFTPGPRLGA